MRIIAGKYKGHKLKMPSSKFTRPTTDRVKESIFNILMNFVDFNNIKVCDIYAGSGSLGLEVLSRGAAEVHFVEKSFSVYNILSQNISAVDNENRCRIFKMDAVKFTRIVEHYKYDLILIDPPFFKNDVYKVIENLMTQEYLSKNGNIVLERSVQTENEDKEALEVEPYKKIGDSLIYLFSS
ncbi:MAG: 16S rRNA (guanine(966)-N(2))-methyltransferase RsmD [Melioribacteraceae bacterium]|nr:16S rRNA (guanine(966)-N(2))-methyltransferase RsmD [Melioribacteraceae bacterium]MDD3558989.1 16S rRNA (guanine(966)-N(2))-methyltransferase RsmD [Melioribacteraceae bacterium]